MPAKVSQIRPQPAQRNALAAASTSAFAAPTAAEPEPELDSALTPLPWSLAGMSIFAPGAAGEPPDLPQRSVHTLRVGPANHPLEREAEQVADRATVRRSASASPSIQMLTAPLKEGSAAPASVAAALARPGVSMEPALRAEMEQRLGHSFAHVRLHEGPEAVRSTHDLNAAAYTVGSDIVFADRVVPGSGRGLRVLAHELTHVLQQSSGAMAVQCAPPTDDDAHGNPWDNLSPDVRKKTEALWDDCDDSIGVLLEAQMVHDSHLRGAWINFLRRTRGRIEAIDSDAKFKGLYNVFHDFEDKIGHLMVQFRTEWSEVNTRYQDLDRWLRSKAIRSTDSIEAAKYLAEIYRGVEGHIPFLVVDDDYAALKTAMDKQEFIRIGALRGARIRAKQLMQMMDAVADLLHKGEVAEKFIPGWSDRVFEEAAYLDSFARLAEEARREYAPEMREMRQRLLDKQQETAKTAPPDESWLGKGADFVKGGVKAVAGIFIEASKEAVDLVQIELHFYSFGKYEPRFISDMAKAAEQGATTTDLLKGMVVGLIDTPSRFLDACRKGDWEAIGRESVNLYMLAETIRGAPEAIEKIPEAVKKLPELVARTRESLAILRQRLVALGLKNEGRFTPEPVSPPVRGFQPPSAPAPAPAKAPPANAPPPPTKPVRGFRSPSDPGIAPQPQTAPPAPSKPVRGFRSPNDPGPAPPPQTPPTHAPAPSNRVRGVRHPSDPGVPPLPDSGPSILVPPTKPVRGFRPPHDPGPAPSAPAKGTGPATQMPPAKQVTTAPPGADPAASHGQTQPTVATAGKKPESSSGDSSRPATGSAPKTGTVDPAKAPATSPAKQPATAAPKTEPPKQAPPMGSDPAKPSASDPAKADPAKAPASAKPILPADELNELVPQDKGAKGPRRRLEPAEREGAKKIRGVLERVRAGDQSALLDLQRMNFRVKALTGDRAGWYEIDVLPGNPGYANQMRVIVRIGKGGDIEAKLLQIH